MWSISFNRQCGVGQKGGRGGRDASMKKEGSYSIVRFQGDDAYDIEQISIN